MSMPWTTMPPRRQLVAVAAGAAPDVEDAIAGAKAERGHDVVDLLHACPS